MIEKWNNFLLIRFQTSKPSTCIVGSEVFWGQVSVEEGLCFVCQQDKLAVSRATHECKQNKMHAHSWVPEMRSLLNPSYSLCLNCIVTAAFGSKLSLPVTDFRAQNYKLDRAILHQLLLEIDLFRFPFFLVNETAKKTLT